MKLLSGAASMIYAFKAFPCLTFCVVYQVGDEDSTTVAGADDGDYDDEDENEHEEDDEDGDMHSHVSSLTGGGQAFD